jgi:hypothetical protein
LCARLTKYWNKIGITSIWHYLVLVQSQGYGNNGLIGDKKQPLIALAFWIDLVRSCEWHCDGVISPPSLCSNIEMSVSLECEKWESNCGQSEN